MLSREFTVLTYDRRGRGESTDTAPYSSDREVEDLDTLIAEAGGRAHLYGYSSGALLAIRAAAQGLPVDRLALLEPPLNDEAGDQPAASDPLTKEPKNSSARGATATPSSTSTGASACPPSLIAGMVDTPAWTSMESVAHTLVYDCVISETTSPRLLRSVRVPTLVLDSRGSTDNLTGWAATVAAQIPLGSHRSLAGQWHGVPDEVMAPVLVEFFHG